VTGKFYWVQHTHGLGDCISGTQIVGNATANTWHVQRS